MQRPDHKSPLSNVKVNPPSAAWDRIEKNLDKKGVDRKWWLAAATIMIMMSVSLFIFLSNSPTHSYPVTSVNQVKPDLPEQADNQDNLNIAVDTLESLHHPSQITVIKNNVKTKHASSIESIQEINFPAIHPAPALLAEDAIVPVQDLAVEQTAQELINSDTGSLDVSPGLKFSYSQSELQSKFLKKKTTAASPASKNNFIVNLAGQWRNPATVYSDLRQLKDEIFSFSSKETKTEQTNE